MISNIKSVKSIRLAFVLIVIFLTLSLLHIAQPAEVVAQGTPTQAEKAQQEAEKAQQEAEKAKDKAAGAKEDKAIAKNLFGDDNGKYKCGNTANAVKTRINFGCLGDKGPKNMGPLEDLLYSLIRFLSLGVGIVLIASIIIAGIQYSTSEGNPEATKSSKDRIRAAVIGLFIYIFAFALIQFLVPGGIFNG